MKFKTKLIAGFGTILLLIALTALLVFGLLADLKTSMHVIVNDSYAGVKLASSLRSELNNMSREAVAYLLERDPALLDEHVQEMERSKVLIGENWNQLNSLGSSPADSALIARISSAYTGYVNTLPPLMELKTKGRQEEAITFYYDVVEKRRAELFEALKDFNAVYDAQIDQAQLESNRTYAVTVGLLAALLGLLLLGGAAIAYGVLRSTTGSLRRVTAAMSGISFRDVVHIPRIPVGTYDEIGRIAEAFNQMAGALEEHTEHLRTYQTMLEQQHARKSRTADMLAHLQGVHDIERMAELFVNEMTPLLGAGYSAFYWSDPEEAGPRRLARVACFAGEDGLEPGRKLVAWGEGLVGQCAKTNRQLLLDDVPEDFIRIRSGLGEALPRHLLFVPVTYEGRVVGVLETASFQPFPVSGLLLLEEINVLFGVALNSAWAYMQNQRLLSESQAITEELQAQSEELQLQQEELSALNEQLEEQYRNTEIKNRELELARSDLEDKNRQVIIHSQYKTEFLANVSHELRTPLNSLLLLTNLLIENKESNLYEKQLAFLRTIHDSGQDLLRLINEILDLSKIEAGKMDILYEPVPLLRVKETLFRQFEPLTKQKGLELYVELEAGPLPETLMTDEAKLQQILKNLLSNAVKFTERGQVALTIRRAASQEVVEAGLALPSGMWVAFDVSDTGIGVPHAMQKMIFEAFRQADGTTSRKYGGTGLGLSISRSLAARLGGAVSLASEPGRGSTFTLLLPLAGARQAGGALMEAGYPPAAMSTPPGSATAGPPTELLAAQAAGVGEPGGRDGQTQVLAGRVVLLVDDDMRNIFALTSVLESFRIRVLFAENGEEALRLLNEQADIDLILMDIMMPKLDGYETIRAIRHADAAYRLLPIIALTAKAMKHDRDLCLAAGANDYISKPIQLEQLLSLLQVWLHR
ncbi:response regulator [Paenibacillus athensensis]|uniref:Circadian input-output histidine kinase CikA n=1 Tax=Paenibacillus athensensis TaxID=1967502 RepID=A0A4Y8PSV1_9BACL|nr:ATP-binding protein [Paenibacillus athensensis]MCD1258612.1 response regulator [Paenibacillus athensensis]